jgi:predicted DNA binding CopG/RHH family protein
VPDTGERGRKYMKKTIKYTDEPMGDVKIVNDFLPSPQELAFKEDTVKITIALSKSSIRYFKRAANKYRVPYQKMIRRLIDEYVVRQQKTN